jgi:Na+/melibiose symporter-like transporter
MGIVFAAACIGVLLCPWRMKSWKRVRVKRLGCLLWQCTLVSVYFCIGQPICVVVHQVPSRAAWKLPWGYGFPKFRV